MYYYYYYMCNDNDCLMTLLLQQTIERQMLEISEKRPNEMEGSSRGIFSGTIPGFV